MFNLKRLAKYLATGVMPEMTALDESLAEHDKKYHPDGYKEGDECNKRDEMANGDDEKINITQRKKDRDKIKYEDVKYTSIQDLTPGMKARYDCLPVKVHAVGVHAQVWLGKSESPTGECGWFDDETSKKDRVEISYLIDNNGDANFAQNYKFRVPYSALSKHQGEPCGRKRMFYVDLASGKRTLSGKALTKDVYGYDPSDETNEILHPKQKPIFGVPYPAEWRRGRFAFY